MQVSNETAITALATKSRAEIEAAFVMAKKFPRNEEDIRIKVLKTCRIPSFAEKAKYRKPQGKVQDSRGKWVQNYVIGPSVRLAEEMFRQWGHIDVETTVLYEDDRRRMVQVRAMDMESGSTNRGQFIIEKVVERKNAKGRTVMEERLNSSGERIFVVLATEDEALMKQNSLASKYRRNLILQLIPVYLLADALDAVDETKTSNIKSDPEKAKKGVADEFASIGVLPSGLEEYLGHPFAQITPDEISELKDIFTTIKDGETTWAEVLAAKADGEARQTESGNLMDAIKPGDESTHKPVDEPIIKASPAQKEEVEEILALMKRIWPKSKNGAEDWLHAKCQTIKVADLTVNQANDVKSALCDKLAGMESAK